MQTTRPRIVKAAALTHGNVIWHLNRRKTVAARPAIGDNAAGSQYADIDFTDGSWTRMGASDDVEIA